MILLKNGNIYTMEKEILDKADILVKDGKIIEIGKDIKANAEEIIDLQGKMVLPGFIDSHCHVGMWEEGVGEEGSDGNEMTDPITPHLRAIDAINPRDLGFKDAYRAGITSLVTGPGSANVIGGMFVALKTYGTRVDDMILKEPVAMKIAFGENPKRVYGNKSKFPMTRMGTAAILRENLMKTKIYMTKKELAKGDINKMPEYNMKYEALEKVFKGEIPLKAHAHRADDIFTAIRIADEFNLDITIDHCSEGHLIAKELGKIGKNCIVGPSFSARSKIELKDKSFRTPAELHKNGLLISIITDAPVIPIEGLAMCAGLAVKSGLDMIEALKAITINAAKITEIDDRVGSIKVGKDADIVVHSKNPVLNIDSEVILTMIDGKIIYKNEDVK